MLGSMKAAFVLATLAPSAFSATYSLVDNHVGEDFLTAFTHEAIADPTHGRVNYVDQATAQAKNLTFAAGNTLILRTDDFAVLNSTGPGRDSVRIRSVKTYTTHVAVIEGINDVMPNAMTLHTSTNCTMPQTREQLGVTSTTDCDAGIAGNPGCSVKAPTNDSYGPAFNQAGGGFYAMERTNTFVKVWFFGRNAANIPSDLSSGAKTVNTDAWGTPTALFPNTQCDIASKFDANNIIINLTLCGDAAGQPTLFAQAGCPGDCATFVDQNPKAFENAFWDIAAVRVYQ